MLVLILRMPLQNQEELSNTSQLIEYYHRTNPEEKLLMGIELERSGVYRDTLGVVPYDGENGYQAIFHQLKDEVGWEVSDEKDNIIFELERGKASLTIEADGRPELAGSPRENLHELSREFRLHDNELREIGNIYNISWLPMGLNPLHTTDEIQLIDKKRYDILSAYNTTPWMENFLKRMNGVHINFSYVNEENMVRKAQTAFRVLPIVAAMYASSPFENGKLGSHLCMRRHMYTSNNAPINTQMPPSILDKDFSFGAWIEHYLDMPVVIIVEAGKEDTAPKNLTFRQWIANGYNGKQPTPFDFDQHIKACWSDIRLRPSYLEYRVVDSTPEKLAMSLPALMKGLIFDSEAWQAVEELTKDWTYQDIIDIDKRAIKTGLQTEVKGKKLLTYAQELITLSNEKLHGFERTEASEEDEAVYLAPLKEQIFIKEKSPAEEMRDLWEGEWNQNPVRILEWCEARV